MAHFRAIGFRYIFTLLIVIGNVSLYALLVFAKPWLPLSDFGTSSRPWAYLLPVLAGVLYSSQLLYNYIDRIILSRLFDAFRVSSHIALAMSIGFALTYVGIKDVSTSRLFLGSFLALSIPFNVLLVRFLPMALSRTVYPDKRKDRAVLVGNGKVPSALINYLHKCDILGIRFIGYFADEVNEQLKLPYLGTRSDLYEQPNLHKIERVLAFNDAFCDDTFRNLIIHCETNGLRLQIYTAFANAFPEQVRVVNDGDLSFFTFQEEKLENPLNYFLKRTLDITVSLPVVVFVLPPLFLWAKWRVSRESPGSLLFKQRRYGRNRDHFTIYKFRSMHLKDRTAGDEGIQATEGDPRVFPFGSFLRKTSLDEFPQFYNVLRGEMSIVGPRPHLLEHDEKFEQLYQAYRSRHFVKPGITGYAQIHGHRGEIKHTKAIIERVQMDLNYIANWSFTLDCYIILRTALQVFFPPRSAY